MKNLGIANVDVKILNSLPYIDQNPNEQHFDVTAFNWDVIQGASLFPPLLAEQVHDQNEGFAAIFPSKRKWFVDNYMDGSPELKCESNNSEFHINWKPIALDKVGGVFSTIAAGFDKYNASEVPVNKTSGVSDKWLGPLWFDKSLRKIPYPDDTKVVNEFLKWTGVQGELKIECLTKMESVKPTECSPIAKTSWIHQSKVRAGMWWGVTSTPFLSDNMPFFVTIKKDMPPTTEKYSSFLVVRVGISDPYNTFDILLSDNMRPRIIDYLMPNGGGEGKKTNGTTEGSQSVVSGLGIEFPQEASRTLSSFEDIEIGVMTVAGRLIVYVNGNSFVYTRPNRAAGEDGSSISACKIPAGSIDIYGTNLNAIINVSPMTFAPMCLFTIPIPKNESANGSTSETTWMGVNEKGEPAGEVTDIYSDDGSVSPGIDCGNIGGANTDNTSPMYHKQGKAFVKKGDNSTFTALPETTFYYVIMYPETIKSGDKEAQDVCLGGCPYFFKIRGKKEKAIVAQGSSGTSVGSKLISIDETASAPDYFHVKKSATVTLYDPGGSLSNLAGKQKGISIFFNGKKTFTGVITNVTTSQVPGKETITLSCEDYIYILKNIPIVNSPFYDGMLATYAIQDLAKKAGISSTSVQSNWKNGESYFLPAGFAFTKPSMKYQPSMKIFDCMMDMIQRFEGFIHFDEEGRLNISKLPGGLFSVVSEDGGPSASFGTNLNSTNLIIGERNVTYSYDSTMSNISVFSLDRDTKNAIIYGQSAENGALAYHRPYLRDQPAFGDLESVKAWVADAAKRMFKSTLKTSFKTAGDAVNVIPFSFVTVDGQNFRIMSVKRTFNADTNEMTATYEGEWLGN